MRTLSFFRFVSLGCGAGAGFAASAWALPARAVRSALFAVQVFLCSLHSLALASAARGRFPLLLSRSSLPLSLLFSPGRPPVLLLAALWGRILSFFLPSRSLRSRVFPSSLCLAPAVAALVRSLLSPRFSLLLVPVLRLPGGLVVVSVFRSGCVLPVAPLRWFAFSPSPVLLLLFASSRLASLVVLCLLVVLLPVSVFRSSSSVSVSLPLVCPGSVVARGVPCRLRACPLVLWRACPPVLWRVTLRSSGSPAHRSCFSSEGGLSH